LFQDFFLDFFGEIEDILPGCSSLIDEDESVIAIGADWSACLSFVTDEVDELSC
jgi:hypothetical protein